LSLKGGTLSRLEEPSEVGGEIGRIRLDVSPCDPDDLNADPPELAVTKPVLVIGLGGCYGRPRRRTRPPGPPAARGNRARSRLRRPRFEGGAIRVFTEPDHAAFSLAAQDFGLGSYWGSGEEVAALAVRQPLEHVVDRSQVEQAVHFRFVDRGGEGLLS